MAGSLCVRLYVELDLMIDLTRLCRASGTCHKPNSAMNICSNDIVMSQVKSSEIDAKSS